tara:strand:- start:37436 stop:37789 length:354 start_codon:yes stop_codon:yes gene_type:complete
MIPDVTSLLVNGHLQIQIDNAQISIDIEGKRIDMRCYNLQDLAHLLNLSSSMYWVKTFAQSLYDSQFRLTLFEGSSAVVRLGKDATPNKVLNILGFKHVEIINIRRLVSIVGSKILS